MEAARVYGQQIVVQSAQVTYAEIRWWARWLGVFTASDLADSMAVDFAVGEKGIRALLWHGLVEDTGEYLDSPWGPEVVVEYQDPRLLPGPRSHPTLTPEWRVTPGCYELARATGMPVRIRSERDMRKVLSTGGGAAAFHRRREKAYQKAQQAREKAEEKARLKRIRIEQEGGPKWRRKSGKHKGRMIDADQM